MRHRCQRDNLPGMTKPLKPMKLQTPASWVAAVTEPSIADFRAQPSVQHRGIAAAREVYHVHERIFQYWGRIDPSRIHNTDDEKDFARYLRGVSRDFEILGDAADATKHHVLRNTTRFVLTASMASTVSGGAITVGPSGPSLLATIDAVMALYRAHYL